MQKNISHNLKKFWKTSLENKYEVLFSFLFSFIFVTGHLLSTSTNIDVKEIGARITIGYFLSFIVIWVVLLFGFLLLKQFVLRKRNPKKTIFLKNLSDKKLWLFTSLFIFICYLPLILMTVAVLSPDSWNSLSQVTGKLPLSNGNPIIFTAFVSVFVNIGLLFGSLEFGTLLFSIAQSAILAIIFARVIVWMRQEKIGSHGIIAAFIYYAILPVNAIAGIIMWKDILFAGFSLIFLILLRKLYIEKDRFFTPKNITAFTILAFLFCTFRNNGFYAYILFFLIIFLLSLRGFVKNLKFIGLLFAPLALAVGYLYIFIPLLSQPTTASYAMLCAPMQQVARTVTYHESSLTDNEKRLIGEILPIDKVGELYNPGLSDPIMGAFKAEKYDENKSEYINLWFNLLAKYPKTFVAATLYNTYGYVYPYSLSPTPTDTVMNNSVHPNAFKDYTDSAFVWGNKQAVGEYSAALSSIAPVVHNIGFYVSMTLLALYIAIRKRKKELVGVFLILFCLFVSTVLGPVNGEFRYLYLFVVALPFILGSVYVDNDVKKMRVKKK